MAERLSELDTHKVGRWERGEQMPGIRPRAALATLWGTPPWEPEADLATLPEFAAWITQNATTDARELLLAALGRQAPAREAPDENTPPLPAAPEAMPGTQAFVPRQLPNGTAHFIGRTAELSRLSALLDRMVDDRPATLLIALIDGTAGIGKTELAIHWAHRVRARFPDGDLYVNLGGNDINSPAVDPDDALSTLLQALQVPAELIPLELSAKVGLYRSLLAGKRLLILLDGAISAEQVRPLLPGGGACMALVTSRNRLPGLAVREGVHRVTLRLFSPEESLDLLRRTVDEHRVAAEPEASKAIARHCAHLPLALRIAADRMASQPYLPLEVHAEELANSSQRLETLRNWLHESALCHCLWTPNYHAMSDQAKRAFLLLGLWAGPDISLLTAMAVLNSDAETTRHWLTEMMNVHLLEQTAVERYQMHDLLRLYAAKLAQDEGGSL